MMPKWIVFDLGGVLVEYIGVMKLREWMGSDITDSDMHRRWLYSPAVRAFESGRMDAEDFAATIVRDFQLTTDAEEFLSWFPDFVKGMYPGAEELLADLAGRHSLAVLSNTNRPQWEKLVRETGVRSYFRHVFLSFETGLMKPDREVFEHLAATLGCEPGEILFFDDNPANIAGAKELGIRAVQVADFEDLRRKVAELGL